jgi:hypothetical protein
MMLIANLSLCGEAWVALVMNGGGSFGARRSCVANETSDHLDDAGVLNVGR